jgi:hypothetical protein
MYTIEPIVFDGICGVPLDFMLLANQYIAAMCTQECEIQVPEDITLNPNGAWIDPRS